MLQRMKRKDMHQQDRRDWTNLFLGLILLLLLTWTLAGQLPQAAAQRSEKVFLAYMQAPPTCSQADLSYVSGPVFQYDLDNPVRPAGQHADKNIDLRGYAPAGGSFKRELVNYGSDDPNQPPQFATLFQPHRVPEFVNFYSTYSWNWASSPNPGTRGSLENGISALGLRTTPGEPLYMLTSGYDIGGGQEALVLFADEDSLALKITREDTAAVGYLVHLDNICVNPALLALYRSLDAPSAPRYVFKSPGQRPHAYDLPTLRAGQQLGTARGSEIVVAIVDTGRFMDPRSCNEWWQIRPGYAGSCPPP